MAQSRWDETAQALLGGNVIKITGIRPNVITGRLSGRREIRGKHAVRTRRQADGVVVWLEQKENR